MTDLNKQDILLYTRPLTPPWDEASKNLAHDLALNSNGTFRFHLLTTNKYAAALEQSPLATKEALVAEPIFKSAKFTAEAKIALLKRLFQKKLDADIVHFLFTPRPLTSLLFRLRLHFSTVKTVQTLATISDATIQQSKKLKKVLFADRIVAQSQITANKLRARGISNIEVIYPGINLEKFSPQEKDKKLLEKLGIKKEELVVLFAGEYTRLKAIDDIVLAFEQLFQQSFPEAQKIKLILACRIKCQQDAVKQTAVQARAKKKGYLDRLVFLETVENMPQLFNLSDINIFPVREMAGKFDIPLAVVEAMACRKAIIVSDIDVLTEFVKDEETGMVIDKGAPQQLAATVLALAKDSKKRLKLAENAGKYVQNNFDIRNVVKRYEKVYTELLG